MKPDLFTFEEPARVTFGVGALAKLPELVAGLGARALVISDPGIVKAGILDRVTSLLQGAGVTGDAFTQVEPNPSIETVNAAHDMFRRSRGAFVVAVGGGSSMDVGKVAAVLAAHGGTVLDYEGLGKVPGPGVPVVGTPTTSGTGSRGPTFLLITSTRTR